jgi:DNA-directed RNA polymerase subunit M/transcription elongation factor TFIIS
MDFTDPQEAQRLQQRYAQMTDGELRAVADEGYELTEPAQQILRAEIRQRGLDIRLREKAETVATSGDALAGDFDPSDLNLVSVHSLWDQAEAIRTKRILNESGIPCYLGPDNLEDENTFNMNFSRGVDLKVRYIDNQRALGAIRCAFDSNPQSEPEINREASIRCPKCNSEEVVFQSRDSEPGTVPDAAAEFNWNCDACGHHWSDDGVEKEA